MSFQFFFGWSIMRFRRVLKLHPSVPLILKTNIISMFHNYYVCFKALHDLSSSFCNVSVYLSCFLGYMFFCVLCHYKIFEIMILRNILSLVAISSFLFLLRIPSFTKLVCYLINLPRSPSSLGV